MIRLIVLLIAKTRVYLASENHDRINSPVTIRDQMNRFSEMRHREYVPSKIVVTLLVKEKLVVGTILA